MKELGISIIIAAYEAEDFIEETLESIYKQQNVNLPFEILIGIDHCQSTLEKVLSLRQKYPKMRIFMMDSNTGPYTVYNSLFDEVQFEYIHIFGADDIMLPGMLSGISQYIPEYDFISSKFEMFIEGTDYVPYPDTIGVAAGVMTFNHKFLESVGGYKPWRFSGDSEMRIRRDHLFKKENFNEVIVDPIGFKYRVHPRSLTNDPKSRQGTSLREQYRMEMKTQKMIPLIKVPRVVNTYKEI